MNILKDSTEQKYHAILWRRTVLESPGTTVGLARMSSKLNPMKLLRFSFVLLCGNLTYSVPDKDPGAEAAAEEANTWQFLRGLWVSTPEYWLFLQLKQLPTPS